MGITLAEIATLIGGELVCSEPLCSERSSSEPLCSERSGNEPARNAPAQASAGGFSAVGSRVIEGAATLRDATAHEISFLTDPAKVQQLNKSQAGAVLAPMGFTHAKVPVIQVKDVLSAFTKVVATFRPPRAAHRNGISSQATISPTAKIGADVDIHAGATIGDDVVLGDGCTIHSGARLAAGCVLGANVTVHANAVLYEGTRVGANSTIHACVVLGADGFGYSFNSGRHVKSAQLGYVEIGSDVDLGPGTVIDRGTFGPTSVGDGTKIDALVMIGHNCRIGRYNLICSQVGFAGSASTGDFVVIAGQAGIRDHVHVGDRARLSAKCGIMNDVPEGASLVGAPAKPEREMWIEWSATAKLPEMRKEFRALQRQVEVLEARLAALTASDQKAA